MANKPAERPHPNKLARSGSREETELCSPPCLVCGCELGDKVMVLRHIRSFVHSFLHSFVNSFLRSFVCQSLFCPRRRPKLTRPQACTALIVGAFSRHNGAVKMMARTCARGASDARHLHPFQHFFLLCSLKPHTPDFPQPLQLFFSFTP